MAIEEDKIRQIQELYLALLGEQCIFITTKVSGVEYRLVEETTKALPQKISLLLDTLVKVSTYVKIIEARKQHTIDTCNSERTADVDVALERNTWEADRIRKAIAESVLHDYNAYLNMVDEMRIAYMNKVDRMRTEDKLSEIQHPFGYISNFAQRWHKRLGFFEKILHLIESKNGMDILNNFYVEYILISQTDWSYGVLERAIHAGYSALSKVVNQWLLDGKLCESTPWAIRMDKCYSKSPNSTIHSCADSCSHFGMQYFASPCSAQELTTDLVITIEKSDSKKEFVLPVYIDRGLIPTGLLSHTDLINLMLDIGRKVHFLKVVRSQPFYEHRLMERKQIVGQFKPEVWYRPPKRGLLSIALYQIHEIVSADMMDELKGRQRLMDHLQIVHSYFFMLRGDLLAEIEQIILVSSFKPSLTSKTPLSMRRRATNSAKMAELYLNEAIEKCSPPSVLSDLVRFFLTAEKAGKVSKERNKSFFELFSLSYYEKGKKDLQRNPIREFFSRDVLRLYKMIFTFSINLQLLHFQLDNIFHRLSHNLRRKLITNTGNSTFVNFIFFNLQNVRAFILRFCNYLFEDVLFLESATILNILQLETNPYNLLHRHVQLLNGIVLALFMNSSTSPIRNVILNCIQGARSLVSQIEHFCEGIERLDQEMPCLNLSNEKLKQFTRQNENLYVNVNTLRQQRVKEGHKNSAELSGTIDVEVENLTTIAYQIHVYSSNFRKSLASFRELLKELLNDQKNKKSSKYWLKLNTLLFQ